MAVAIGFAAGLTLSIGLGLPKALSVGVAEGAAVTVWSCATDACGSSAHPSASKAAIVIECFIALSSPAEQTANLRLGGSERLWNTSGL